MPVLHCYVSDETMRTLEEVARNTGRELVELAESAIAETALDERRSTRNEHRTHGDTSAIND